MWLRTRGGSIEPDAGVSSMETKNDAPKSNDSSATSKQRRKPADSVVTAPIEETLKKYQANGWSAHRVKDGPNHIIAHKDKKLHFVQVVTPETVGGAEYQDGGIPRNTFIQNAFSNGAVPVHALVTQKRGGASVSFTNVNDNARIIIATATRKASTKT